MDKEGREWKKVKEIPKVFTAFYQELFTTEGIPGLEESIVAMEPCVTQEMNEDLLKVFTMEEIDAALAQMYPLKSPGPDGFSACFYQHSWAIVRREVCKVVLDFLNFGIFDHSLNTTHIILIPKIKNPS